MALGYSTLLLFFLLTLGNVNNFCVENRSLLSLCGIACVGMGLCVCYGLCALLGYPTSQGGNSIGFLDRLTDRLKMSEFGLGMS